MRLLLIRHGQTPANVLGQLDTAHPGPGLTELGCRQAKAIPAALVHQPIDELFASTLVRTQITAAPLAQTRGLTVQVCTGLHEVEAGDLEGRNDAKSVRLYLETVFAWGAGQLDVALPGGPNGRDFFGRYNADLEAITASGASTAAVVSHGAAIRVWVAAHAINVPPTFASENHLDNTGVVEVEGTFAQGWTLTRWADQPIGGTQLADSAAGDPAGETLSEARAG
ncbi:MAG: histidine phosphatase family protein [Homoserinimonas sp.]|jgi:broad specificity phosphatase PhoE|nr:histidine phosphatase family protein [Homoserinimonas sp.]